MYGSRPNKNFEQRSFAPVKEGDELDVIIEAVGEKGDGICKKNGFVLFVPSTNEGDEVTIKVTKVLKKVGFAEVVAKREKSAAAPMQKKQEKPEDDIPKGEESEDFGEESTVKETPAVEPAGEEVAEEKPEEEHQKEVPAEEKEDDIDEPPAP